MNASIRLTIRKTVSRFLPLPVRQSIEQYLQMREWRGRDYQMPAPIFIKQMVLSTYGNRTGCWIETGTFLGDTTDFLAKAAKHVYSIEPSPELVARARKRFQKRTNVSVLEGLSENLLGSVLDSLRGPVSLWLDGHWSGGFTFQGPQDTPILDELQIIEERLNRFDDIRIFIDDVRCFASHGDDASPYPSRTQLVEWADKNNLKWMIVSDIFVAGRRDYLPSDGM